MPDAGKELRGRSPPWQGSPTSLWGFTWSSLPPPLSREGFAVWSWPERQTGFRCEQKSPPAPFMRQPGRGGDRGTQSPPHGVAFRLCPHRFPLQSPTVALRAKADNKTTFIKWTHQKDVSS